MKLVCDHLHPEAFLRFCFTVMAATAFGKDQMTFQDCFFRSLFPKDHIPELFICLCSKLCLRSLHTGDPWRMVPANDRIIIPGKEHLLWDLIPQLLQLVKSP